MHKHHLLSELRENKKSYVTHLRLRESNRQREKTYFLRLWEVWTSSRDGAPMTDDLEARHFGLYRQNGRNSTQFSTGQIQYDTSLENQTKEKSKQRQDLSPD